MRYIVIKVMEQWELEQRVTSLLQEGWTLVGGLCVIDARSSMYYCQAMVGPDEQH